MFLIFLVTPQEPDAVEKEKIDYTARFLLKVRGRFQPFMVLCETATERAVVIEWSAANASSSVVNSLEMNRHANKKPGVMSYEFFLKSKDHPLEIEERLGLKQI